MSKSNKKAKAFLPAVKPLPPAPTFHVGPYLYTLSITSGPMIEDGRPIHVAWLESSREVVLSRECPPADRMSSILYALMSAWIAHTGEPVTTDGWCDLTATAMQQFALDVAASTANLNHLLPAA